MRLLSLFSGIGLHDLGLERAGWEIAGQVENDPWCSAVLARHWPGVPRWEDVRDVTAESIRERAGAVDLITGGFPCTDISLAGKGAGLSGEQSGLWREMLRIIRGVAPSWVFAENVPALRTRGAEQVVSDLEKSGYTVLPPVVVGAWAAGAPHRRDRVWIVARRVADADCIRRGGRGATSGRPPRGVASGPERAEFNGARVADSDGGGRAQLGGGGIFDGKRPACGGDPDGRDRRPAWPAGRGEPQHPREPSRLTQSSMGGGADGHASRLDGSAGGDREKSARIAAKREARFRAWCHRQRLRALGNANPPHVPELIGRWILEQGSR